jgi:hypothetical protein
VKSNFELWYDEHGECETTKEVAHKAYRAGYDDCAAQGNHPSHLEAAMLNGQRCIELSTSLASAQREVAEMKNNWLVYRGMLSESRAENAALREKLERADKVVSAARAVADSSYSVGNHDRLIIALGELDAALTTTAQGIPHADPGIEVGVTAHRRVDE